MTEELLEKKLLISVVMITYKHEIFISKAIEGVLMQEVDFDVELIIADDNSPDRTTEIVEKIKITHPKGHWIKYSRHLNNKGMIPNYIWAIEQASGKYIALCEGDDYWTDPSKLQKQFDFMEQNRDYSLCLGNLECLDEVNNRRYNRILTNVDLDITTEDLLRNPFYGMTASGFMRLEVLKKELISTAIWPLAGEVATWLIASKYGKIKVLKDIFGVYRINSGSIHLTKNYQNKDMVNERKFDFHLELESFFEKGQIKELNLILFNLLFERVRVIRKSNNNLKSIYLILSFLFFYRKTRKIFFRCIKWKLMNKKFSFPKFQFCNTFLEININLPSGSYTLYNCNEGKKQKIYDFKKNETHHKIYMPPIKQIKNKKVTAVNDKGIEYILVDNNMVNTCM